MPNKIDDIIAQISKGQEKPKKKQEYRPAKGEEAIFARQPGLVERMGFLGSLLPFSKQLTGQEPWSWNPETVMEGLNWASGGLIRGRGMPKEAIKKGSAPIAQALEDIMAKLGKSTGNVPAVIPEGPLPALGGGRFQRMGEDILEGKTTRRGRTMGEVGTRDLQQLPEAKPFEMPGSPLREPGQIARAIERKQLPQYAGPTAPGGIPQSFAPQTWREQLPGKLQNSQDVIEDLIRESLKMKGLID